MSIFDTARYFDNDIISKYCVVNVGGFPYWLRGGRRKHPLAAINQKKINLYALVIYI